VALEHGKRSQQVARHEAQVLSKNLHIRADQ
jgi:hypothetical protein